MSLYRANKNRGFAIISVLVDNENRDPATVKDAKKWALTYGITYPVLADTQAAVWNIYNEEDGVPLNLIIDRDLVIKFKGTGYRKGLFETTIEGLLVE